MINRTVETLSRTTWLVQTLLLMGCVAVVALSSSGCKSWTGGRDVVLLDTRGMVPAAYATDGRGEAIEDVQSGTSVDVMIPEEPYQVDIIPLGDDDTEPLQPLMPDDADVVEASEGEGIELPTDVDTEPVTYTVKKGDSLWAIGRMYGVTHQELAAYNDMKLTDILRVGQTLRIPPGGVYDPDKAPTRGSSTNSATRTSQSSSRTTSSSTAPMPKPGDKYTVRKGDSLWKVARQLDVKVNDIKRLNNLESDTIYQGQVLVVPQGATRSASSGTLGTSDDDDVLTTLTRTGDQSEEAETTTTTTTTTRRDVGRSVPEFQPESTLSDYTVLEHTVLGGESLDEVAAMYGTSVEMIMKANPDLKADQKIQPGMELKIPLD